MNSPTERELKRRTNVAVFRALGLGTALLAAMIAPAFAKDKKKVAEPEPAFGETPVHLVSADSSRRADGAKLTFPARVDWARYDPTTRLLIARYDPTAGKKHSERTRDISRPSAAQVAKGKVSIAAYDLDHHRVAWTLAGGPDIFANRDGIAILSFQSGTKKKLLNLSNGEIIGDINPSLVLLEPGGIPLVLTQKEYARYDLKTGKAVWSRKGSACQGTLRMDRLGDSLFVVADGLHALDLNSGGGWDFAASTSRSGVGKMIAKEIGKGVALGILGALTGTMPTAPASDPELTHDLYAAPLIETDRVYFAARGTAVCLDRQSGKPVWQANLGSEPGAMRLLPAGPDVAVVGLGWQYVDNIKKKAAPPSITLIARDSGTVIARAEFKDLGESDEVRECRWTEEGVFVLTSDHLFRCDHQLNMLGALDASSEYGSFVRFLPSENTLVIQATSERLEVSPATLEVVATHQSSMAESAPAAGDSASAAGGVATESAGEQAPAAAPDVAELRRIFGLEDYTVSGGALLFVEGRTVTVIPPAVAR